MPRAVDAMLVGAPARRAVPATAVGALVALLALAALPAPALAAEAPAAPAGPSVPVTFVAREAGCGEGATFCFSPSGLGVHEGERLNVTLLNAGQTPHNLCVQVEGEEMVCAPGADQYINGGESAELEVAITGPARYWCNVPGHDALGMEGNIVLGPVGEAAEGGGEVAAVRALGVNFYAYWVGVISFIVLFVVLAATFFLLRYGESQHWTDQKDRPVKDKADAAPAKMTGTWIVLALVLVVFLVSAVQILRVV